MRAIGWRRKIPLRARDVYGAEFARRHVLEQVLPFWERHSVDRRDGGFLTCLDRRGEVYDTSKSPAMNARMVFAFSIGHELDPHAGHLELARHGVDFLLEDACDHERGGWHDLLARDGSLREEGKRLFTQAYVLFGLAHHARVAGDDELLARVLDAYDVVDTHGWDRVHGGYYAKCAADWSPILDRKSICLQLDFMKVVHVLHELTGEARFADRMVQLADIVALRMRDPRHGSVVENCTRDWVYAPQYTNDRLELGHNLKAVRWLLETHALAGDPRHAEAADGILEFALKHGWDRRYGAFYQHLFRSGRLAEPQKEWWPQCEGVWALLLTHRRTGDPRHLQLAQALMHFCFTHFADHQHGDWYMSCHPDGTPADDRKGGPYKAAYHVVDACMAPVTLLEQGREPAASAAG